MKKLKFIAVFLVLLTTSCYIPQTKPNDFDEFWENSLKGLGDKVIFEVVKDSLIGNKRLTINKIKSFQDVDIYAYVCEPIENGNYPVFVKFNVFGRGHTDASTLPSEWFLKEANNINMVVDVRGQGLSTDQIGFEGYLTNGLEDKNDFIYRGAFLDAVKAIDFISQNERCDGNIVVTGESQGGTFSMVATALNKKVTMCLAGFPFLTDIHSYDKRKWPMKIWIHQALRQNIDYDDLYTNLSYFDVLNFADKIDAPVFIKVQEADTLTPKEGAIKLFESIKVNKKELYLDPCEGQGCSDTSQEAKKREQIFIKNNLSHTS
ncbi:MAG: acetylxylan esterase [Aequorivita sp.]|nr:acetylxylan esterase [Aequorivita sp.]MCB0746009.1 acetylxylan esterase [Ignavibacteriota bacterium]